MRDDALTLRPAAVVLEFSGNRFTTCMHHPDGGGMGDGDAFLKYLDDARAAVRIFASVGTHVYLAGAPVSRPVPGSFQRGRGLNVMYRWLALLSPPGTVTYVDAGTAVQLGSDYVDDAAVPARGTVRRSRRNDRCAVERRSSPLPWRRLPSRPRHRPMPRVVRWRLPVRPSDGSARHRAALGLTPATQGRLGRVARDVSLGLRSNYQDSILVM